MARFRLVSLICALTSLTQNRTHVLPGASVRVERSYYSGINPLGNASSRSDGRTEGSSGLVSGVNVFSEASNTNSNEHILELRNEHSKLQSQGVFTSHVQQHGDLDDNVDDGKGAETSTSPEAQSSQTAKEKEKTEWRQKAKVLETPFDDIGADDSWRHTASSGPSSGSRVRLNITDNDEIYNQATDTVRGIGFLGTGYDLVIGNPMGDERTSGDPGYKAPVISFTWQKNRDGVSQDLTTLQPVGGFVRDYVSCKKSEKVEEIENLDDYVTDLSVDASATTGVPFIPFSGSSRFSNFVEDSIRRERKAFKMSTYCYRWDVGISSVKTLEWTPTVAFGAAVKLLPEVFPGLNESFPCPPEVYRQNPKSRDCENDAIQKWMQLFKDFGTHVTTNVKLGGKIQQTILLTKEQAKQMHEKNSQTNAEAEAAFNKFFNASVNATNGESTGVSGNTYSSSTIVVAVGGQPPKDPSNADEVAEWAKTIEDLPMPIRCTLESLATFLPETLQEAYRQASVYYARTAGMTHDDLAELYAKHTSITSAVKNLEESTSVVVAGAAPGFVDCPAGQKVIMGAALHMQLNTFDGASTIKACQIGSNRCEGQGARLGSNDDSRIWAVCSPRTLENLDHHTLSRTTAAGGITCNDEKVVVFGIQLSLTFDSKGFKRASVGHCSTGAAECRLNEVAFESTEEKAHHLLYAVCGDRQSTGVKDLFMVSSVGVVNSGSEMDKLGTAMVDCGNNGEMLEGFALELAPVMSEVRRGFNSCSKWKRRCTLRTYVLPSVTRSSSLPWNSAQKNARHTSVAFGLCRLKEGAAVETAPASRAKQ